MNTKIEHAKLLVSQKKFKKALQLIKKVNQKPSAVSFDTVELEAICLFRENSNKQAYLKMQQALHLAATDTQKISALSNLAAVCENLYKIEEAILFLKQSLALDGSLRTAGKRYSLVRMANSIKDNNTLQEYAPLLCKVTEFAVDTMMMLSQVAIETGKFDEAQQYLSRIVVEIRTEGRKEVKQSTVVAVLNGFHTIKAFKREQELLNFLESKFRYESWFDRTQNRLALIEKDREIAESSKKVTAILRTEESASLLVHKTPVSDVSSETPKLAHVIKRLKVALESHGASFHPDLTIVEDQGELTVNVTSLSEKNETLIAVPLKCIPLVNDYRFSIDTHNMLAMKAKKNMRNPDARVIMELLVALYNACNKIEKWKHSFPLFLLAGFDSIFNKLVQTQSSAVMYQGYYAPSFDEISDAILIKSFLGSRVLNFDSTDLLKIGIKAKNKLEAGFLPIVDLINHRMGANTFVVDSSISCLRAFTGIGDAGREVFAQYNLDDPLITLLCYGFVDTSAKWIYTLPVTLKTESGLLIKVNNDVTEVMRENVPKHLLGLADFFPAEVNRIGILVTVSKLVIPGTEYSDSLRSILSHILKNVDYEGIYNDPDKLFVEIRFIERQIIAQNEKYWFELKGLVLAQQQSDRPLPTAVIGQLTKLYEFYINHINNYIAHTGHLFKA
jgi:tetratricopeptide (TPR) repeat protein